MKRIIINVDLMNDFEISELCEIITESGAEWCFKETKKKREKKK